MRRLLGSVLPGVDVASMAPGGTHGRIIDRVSHVYVGVPSYVRESKSRR